MKKIIILIAILCGMGFCKIDYNKAMEHLGGNCMFERDLSKNNEKIFFCDSGFISFDFDKHEIILSFETKIDDHKRTVHLLFNRAWNKKGKQIHKEKSTIAIVTDEFSTEINSVKGTWSGDGGDFYQRFKEDVYYGKQNVKMKNEEPVATEESVYSTENEVKDSEPKDQYTEYRISQIMEKYK